jgi:hypothetical protein
MAQKVLKPIQQFFRRLFGVPFQELPSEFGDPVPPELRAFEVEAKEIQHHPQGNVHSSNSGGSKQTKPHH